MGVVCAAGMASNASATETRFLLDLAGSTVKYVDTMAIMSRLNQRLYRQGMVPHIDVRAVPNNTPGTVVVSRLPNTWYVRKAWGLAKEAWLQSTADERALGAKAGRWNDFRVFFDGAHTAANSVTTAFGHLPLTNGEINYTQAARADTGALLEYNFVGATSATRWGILDEYDKLADTDQNTPPAVSTNMPYRTLLADVSSQQADQIQEEGDDPPYDAQVLQNNYIAATTSIQTNSQCDRTGYRPTPCGLLVFSGYGDGQNPPAIEISIKPGSYKGIHAEVMA